jgi:hypothetical protein
MGLKTLFFAGNLSRRKGKTPIIARVQILPETSLLGSGGINEC